ncbi:hypothetical protein [Microbacterium sp. TWP3-1-2b2]|uniref:hypothetical protein n=1 Tax=Microbacterium sp. TWP3-1-2b2 TaxID=2804651 RepID=UPI003CF9043A
MRLGRVLLVLGPVLVVSHVLGDTVPVLAVDPVWTYTVASYDIAVIITIIGVALAWRAPPDEAGRA